MRERGRERERERERVGGGVGEGQAMMGHYRTLRSASSARLLMTREQKFISLVAGLFNY